MSAPPLLLTLDSYVGHFAASSPAAEACVHGTSRLTHAELEGRVSRLAGALIRGGLAAGDRLAVLSTPRPEYLILINAILRAGGIYVGLNPRHTPAEMAYVLRLTSPARLFCLREAYGIALAEMLTKACTLAGIGGTAVPFSTPDDLPAGESCPAGSILIAPEAPAVIVFTSGTTGRPKGATLHHSGLIRSALSQWEHLAVPRQRMLSNLPVNHVGCVLNLTYGTLVGGGTLIFQEKFDAGDALRLIEAERINTWLQVPAMFQMVVSHPDFERRDLSSLEAICAGGGALPASVIAALRRTGARLYTEYGQTEVMSTVAFADHGTNDHDLATTVGRFDPHFDIRIADEIGQPVPQGSIGEIQARGDCVMRGYWNDPDATKATFTVDDWLKTGDLARQRPDGLVEIKGRISDMIKSGGYNLYPREIEMALETHPAVEMVAVVGVPDPTFGEAAHAVVTPRPGVAIDADAAKSWCAKTLANYKIPREFHRLDAFPRLPNGKINRKLLAAMAISLPRLA